MGKMFIEPGIQQYKNHEYTIKGEVPKSVVTFIKADSQDDEKSQYVKQTSQGFRLKLNGMKIEFYHLVYEQSAERDNDEKKPLFNRKSKNPWPKRIIMAECPDALLSKPYIPYNKEYSRDNNGCEDIFPFFIKCNLFFETKNDGK